MDRQPVKIHVLGTSLTINTDEDPEHMARVIRYLEKKVADTERLVKLKDPLKLSILCSLLLTDELLKERSKGGSSELSEKDSLEMERITQSMIHRIDTSMDG